MSSLERHALAIEKEDLDARISALNRFILTPEQRALPDAEKLLLGRQIAAMETYSITLGERIAIP